jgi:hypothetical protein
MENVHAEMERLSRSHTGNIRRMAMAGVEMGGKT